jgi:hypothetical protein
VRLIYVRLPRRELRVSVFYPGMVLGPGGPSQIRESPAALKG